MLLLADAGFEVTVDGMVIGEYGTVLVLCTFLRLDSLAIEEMSGVGNPEVVGSPWESPQFSSIVGGVGVSPPIVPVG